MVKPITTRDSLQSDLQGILASTQGKLDPTAAEKIKQAMDRLLEQDNKFNRELLVNTVDELLIIGDSSALHKEELKSILKFLESLRDFLGIELKRVYELDNVLREEHRKKINQKMEDIREIQTKRFGR